MNLRCTYRHYHYKHTSCIRAHLIPLSLCTHESLQPTLLGFDAWHGEETKKSISIKSLQCQGFPGVIITFLVMVCLCVQCVNLLEKKIACWPGSGLALQPIQLKSLPLNISFLKKCNILTTYYTDIVHPPDMFLVQRLIKGQP